MQPNCEHREHLIGSPRTIAVASFFTLREGTRWNAKRQAVEFGVEIRRVPRGGPGAAACVPAPAPGAVHPERWVEAYYLKRTRFESIAERKLRRRQLTEDGNVGISGRDLR